MQKIIYPLLCCALIVLYPVQAEKVQPLSTVAAATQAIDWKQANQKVAEVGGWQSYASEAGGHHGMDHSKHQMPMDHSKHQMPMDHSKHQMPVDHSKHQMPVDHSKHQMPVDHSNHQMPVDHSKHQMPVDHSKHQMPVDHSKHQMPVDHSQHKTKVKPAKAGDDHAHHH
jgi:hypothetical protein